MNKNWENWTIGPEAHEIDGPTPEEKRYLCLIGLVQSRPKRFQELLISEKNRPTISDPKIKKALQRFLFPKTKLIENGERFEFPSGQKPEEMAREVPEVLFKSDYEFIRGLLDRVLYENYDFTKAQWEIQVRFGFTKQDDRTGPALFFDSLGAPLVLPSLVLGNLLPSFALQFTDQLDINWMLENVDSPSQNELLIGAFHAGLCELRSERREVARDVGRFLAAGILPDGSRRTSTEPIEIYSKAVEMAEYQYDLFKSLLQTDEISYHFKVTGVAREDFGVISIEDE